MRVTPCPICGRTPKIDELVTNKHYKNGIRRRMIGCGALHSVIPRRDRINTWGLIYEGDGDANCIYREWNKALEMYEANKNKNVTWRNWSDYQYYEPKEGIKVV